MILRWNETLKLLHQHEIQQCTSLFLLALFLRSVLYSLSEAKPITDIPTFNAKGIVKEWCLV